MWSDGNGIITKYQRMGQMETMTTLEPISETQAESKAKELIALKEKEVSDFLSSKAIAKIVDQTTFDKAIDIAKEARKRAKELDVERVSITGPLNQSLSRINALFKPQIAKYEAFDKGLNRLCNTYNQEQEAIRLEQQRKADEEARKERERIEAQARAQREKEAAAKREAEEAETKAKQAKNEAERAKLQAEADKKRREAEAAAAKAETKEAVAQTVVAPVIEKKVEARGNYGVERWTVQVKDMAQFVRWALEKGMLEYLAVNESLLNKEAQATKGARQWPGIAITKSVEARRRDK
jgi:hypothetical protein